MNAKDVCKLIANIFSLIRTIQPTTMSKEKALSNGSSSSGDMPLGLPLPPPLPSSLLPPPPLSTSPAPLSGLFIRDARQINSDILSRSNLQHPILVGLVIFIFDGLVDHFFFLQPPDSEPMQLVKEAIYHNLKTSAEQLQQQIQHQQSVTAAAHKSSKDLKFKIALQIIINIDIENKNIL